MPRLIYGVGVRDLPYQIAGQDGSPQRDPCYAKWSDMLMRCYSTKYKSKYPRYHNCRVEPEWHTFSVFRGWMVSKDWEGMALDKDLIRPGCKIYGPQTCAFIPEWLNAFLAIFTPRQSLLPMGVSREGPRYRSRYDSQNGQIRLGVFDSPADAHLAYLKYRLTRLEENLRRYNCLVRPDENVSHALSRLISSERKAIEQFQISA